MCYRKTQHTFIVEHWLSLRWGSGVRRTMTVLLWSVLSQRALNTVKRPKAETPLHRYIKQEALQGKCIKASRSPKINTGEYYGANR